MSSPCQCFLCKSEFSRAKDKYLIQRRSKENLPFELNSLPFSLTFNSSDYLCWSCVNTLKKRRSLIEQLKQIEERFKSFHQSSCVTSPGAGSKRSLPNEFVFSGEKTYIEPGECDKQVSAAAAHVNTFQSTPVRSSKPVNLNIECIESPIKASQATAEATAEQQKTNVFVKVEWPSKDRERKLPEDLESIGKMLVRGTYKQIANAIWKNIKLKRELFLNVMKDVDKECANLCSRKNASCLRSPTKEGMLSFSMKRLNNELHKRTPITYAMLTAASVTTKRKDSKKDIEEGWSTAVGVAASVCLRNRSMFMNALQLQISIFTYHTSWLVSFI